MLQISQLTKSYDKSASPLFKAFDLELAKGSVAQIVGSNGIGKTTLLKCLSGYLSCEYKALQWDKKALSCHHTAFASTDDHCFFPKLSLKENLNFFKNFYNSPVELASLIDELQLTADQNKSYQTCSTGIKKRVSLVRALLKESPLLLLDEPFANMDPQFEKHLLLLLENRLKERQISIVFSSNNPEDYFKQQKTHSLKPWDC